MDDLTRRNIRKIEEIKKFAPREMIGFLNNLISVEEKFETVRRFIDSRQVPAPSQTYELSFTLTDLCNSYLNLLNDLHNPSDYYEIAKIFKGYYTFLKTDKDNKNALARAYTPKANREVDIYHFFGTHFLEIHRLLLNSLFEEYHFIQKEFLRRYLHKSVIGIKMLPDNFNPESKTSNAGSDIEIGEVGEEL